MDPNRLIRDKLNNFQSERFCTECWGRLRDAEGLVTPHQSQMAGAARNLGTVCFAVEDR